MGGKGARAGGQRIARQYMHDNISYRAPLSTNDSRILILQLKLRLGFTGIVPRILCTLLFSMATSIHAINSNREGRGKVKKGDSLLGIFTNRLLLLLFMVNAYRPRCMGTGSQGQPGPYMNRLGFHPRGYRIG